MPVIMDLGESANAAILILTSKGSSFSGNRHYRQSIDDFRLMIDD